MTTLCIIPFEGGGTNEQTTSGTASYTATAIHGDYAGLVNPATTSTGYFTGDFAFGATTTWLAASSTGWNTATTYLSFYLTINTLPSSSQEKILRFMTYTGGANKGYLWLTSGGDLILEDNASHTSTASGAVSAGNTYRIDVKVPTSSSTTAYELRVNGSTVVDGPTVGAWNWNTTNGCLVRFGKYINTNGQGLSITFDSIVAADSAYIADGYDYSVLAMRPDSVGSTSQFNSSGGGGAVYTDVTTLPWGTSTYSISTTPGDIQLYGFESTSTAGISGTIHSVGYHAIMTPDAGTSICKGKLLSGATASDGSAASFSASGSRFHHIWDTDPNTASAWTTTALDSIEAGVEEDSGSSNRVRIAGLYLSVVFTAAGGSPDVEVALDASATTATGSAGTASPGITIEL